MDRRARTRRLIELGGLVDKSGLEEAVAAAEPDTRAVILGALLQLADVLREPTPGSLAAAHIARWRERGRAELRAEPVAGSAVEARTS